MRRRRRSLAAVESRYVRDLGRRDRGSSPAARPAAPSGYCSATERVEAAAAPRGSALFAAERVRLLDARILVPPLHHDSPGPDAGRARTSALYDDDEGADRAG
ncbi:MAG: hypothetical protein JWN32_1343 [Solirubrobacterales bacterium]|nr:hypothetical protein [Solirubrobacterales bacterium]